MSVTLIFENALDEPVLLLLANSDRFSDDVKDQMDEGTGSGPGTNKRLVKEIGARQTFSLNYVSASSLEKTGTHGKAGSIAYFARGCDLSACDKDRGRWPDKQACENVMGCDHGGLPGVGNAQFEFDVDSDGRLWADLTAIDGVADKEIFVDYGDCGDLGEAYCSMPPDISQDYQFETYGKRKFASSYQFSCMRSHAKGAEAIDPDVIKKNGVHFPVQGSVQGAAYDFSGTTPSSCQNACAMGGLSLKTAAMQMSVKCGCTGCTVNENFSANQMNVCSGRTSGPATVNDLCRPPKGFQGSTNNNVTDTDYYKKLNKRCTNTYLYPYDDQNSTTQCKISTNPKVKITIRDPGSSLCKAKLLLVFLIILGVLLSGVSAYIVRNRVTRPLLSPANAQTMAMATVITGGLWLVLTVPLSRATKTTWWFWGDCSVSPTTTCRYSKTALAAGLVSCGVLITLLAGSLYYEKISAFPRVPAAELFALIVVLTVISLTVVSMVVKKKWFIWQRSCP
jgi:hypothetical protein